ncbi:hypothetical protein C8R47DRAFT_706044 [Mycena vitilis]|nr:hypothetical protein C8R47DRAFT_706044 [Mycena vitilis]
MDLSFSVEFVDSGFQIPCPSRQPSRLRGALWRHERLLRQFFVDITPLYVIPVLSSLSLCGTYPTETSALSKYLSHIGSALHYLRLQSDPLRPLNKSEAPPTGLQYSTGLQRLDLIFRGYGDVGSTVLSAVSHVRSRNLARLDVIDDFGSSTIMENKWRLLDTVLADGQFTSLQVVNMHSKSASLVARISHLMASSEKRGILRIVALPEPPGSSDLTRVSSK